MLKNRAPAHVSADRPADAVPEGFTEAYPVLWEYLTQTSYGKDGPRIPSSVSVFMQAGKWTACLTEKNWGLILFATADRLEQLPEALNARLADPRADWRQDRKQASDKAKRVQKPT